MRTVAELAAAVRARAQAVQLSTIYSNVLEFERLEIISRERPRSGSHTRFAVTDEAVHG
jgi:Fe2+ or Zn2+ uptake regulation protein